MNDATTKQIDFIVSLLGDRDVSQEMRLAIDAGWGSLTKWEASSLIETLKNLPYKKKSVSFSTPSALAELPKSYYAISSHAVNLVLRDEQIDNDYMFVVVAEFKGTRYMRKLLGNLGGFTRVKLSYRDARAVADLLSTEPLMFIQKFGELHSVCGKCGAELTDEKSRKFGFGPDCRKELGIK